MRPPAGRLRARRGIPVRGEARARTVRAAPVVSVGGGTARQMGLGMPSSESYWFMSLKVQDSPMESETTGWSDVPSDAASSLCQKIEGRTFLPRESAPRQAHNHQKNME